MLQLRKIYVMPEGIAIIGIGCRYPDADGPRDFWENILSKRRAFRRIPQERLSLESYYSPDRSAPDKTYSAHAALIQGLEFDRVGYRIAGTTFRATDIAQWLALQVAAEALEDAGCSDSGSLPRDTTGVILGNTLTGETSRANTLRLRWPYVRKTLIATLMKLGVSKPEQGAIVEDAEERYKSAFPAVNHENLAGGLSNTIAGRICNHFDFHGGGYTVDGACAASLLSVSTACSHLESHDLDLVLAGGVDISLDPFELIGFAKMGALAEREMHVYDQRSSGFLPGEGCGMVVLKRLEDARTDGDRIYAVIRGWGMSSDGQGGLTTPSSAGQALAIRRAYKRAGYKIATVSLIEGHGTGTTVGDRVELLALAEAVNQSSQVRADDRPIIGIGSVKANIGHTKAAAGIAGLIKAIFAVNNQILPPMPGCGAPSEEFRTNPRSVYPVRSARLWDRTRPLRAGVSAFGFGGINTHVTIESLAADRRTSFAPDERRLISTNQDSEVFFFAARRADELQDQLRRIFRFAARIGECELADLAATLARQIRPGDVRAAIIASSPAELHARLEQLMNIVGAVGTAQEFSHIDVRAGVFCAHSPRPVRVGFLYPGQGVQQINMGRPWYERCSVARQTLERADGIVGRISGEPLSDLIFRDIDRSSPADREQWSRRLTETRVAQPAIAATSAAMAKVLRDYGVMPLLAIGYSLGEWTALWNSGMIAEEDFYRCVAARGRAMESTGTVNGAMATVAAPPIIVEEIIRAIPGYVTVAGYNTPNQAVVSGEKNAVQKLVAHCRERGIPAISLHVSNAFHSELVSSAASIIKNELQTMHLGEPAFPVISTITGSAIRPDQVKEILYDQILKPVRFLDAVREAERFGIDVFVEVGPGRSLSNMAAEINVQGLRCVLFTDDEGGTSFRSINMTLGCLFALGVPVRTANLFADRFTRPFPLDYNPNFIQSPCEVGLMDDRPGETIEPVLAGVFAPAIPEAADGSPPPERSREQLSQTGSDGDVPPDYNSVLDLVLDLAASITEYPRELIKPDNLLLHDLNLNSIASAQLVAEAARKLGLSRPAEPTEYSTASLEQVSQTLFELSSTKGSREASVEEGEPPGISAWVRPFRIEMQEQRLQDTVNQFLQPGKSCVLIGERRDPLVDALRKRLLKEGLFVEIFHTAIQCDLDNLASKEGPLGACIYVHPGPEDGRAINMRTARLSSWQAASVRPMFSAARAIARFCTGRKSRDLFLGVVERSGGWLGRGPVDAADNPFAACSGVFKTLHLELDLPSTSIVDCSPDTDCEALAGILLKEFQQASGFREVGYDAELVRRVPALRVLELRNTSSVALSRNDVLLVTGGARGVAAKWALALAMESKCKVALIGRTIVGGSGSEASAEVLETMERFDRGKLTCRYYSCDVSNRIKLQEAIGVIREDLGEITAVLHAAGTNIPQATRSLTDDTVEQTLAPKISGTLNLLQALPLERVKIFITFGSIIAQTGMPGQAAYAFANEWMNRAVLHIRRTFPSVRWLSVNSSVWAGVGMGERLGSVDALSREGVTPIRAGTGLGVLVELMRNEDGAPEVVLCGRVGSLPTLRFEDCPVPVFRFLEKKRVHYPRVELITESELSTSQDPYLIDHLLDGMHLFPAVLGVEAMVQAASCLVPGETSTAVGRLEFPRPIMIPPGGSTRIRLMALVEGGGSVEVAIRSSETNFSLDHFRGHVFFGEETAVEKEVMPQPGVARQDLLPLSPRTDLYGRILFQGPMFQHLNGYRELSATTCAADIRRDGDPKLFGQYQPQTLLTGDPSVRDAFIHSIQPCVPQAVILPLSIERIRFYRPIDSFALLTLLALERKRGASEYVYDVEVRSPDGKLVEVLTGFRSRAIGVRSLPLTVGKALAVSPALLAPYLERHVQSIDPSETCAIAVALHDEDGEATVGSLIDGVNRGRAGQPRQRSDQSGLGYAVKDFLFKKMQARIDHHAFTIEHTTDGRPVVRLKEEAGGGPLIVSAAHMGRLTLALVSDHQCACDVEIVKERPDVVWRDLLGEDGVALATLIAAEVMEPLSSSCTRVWTLIECLKKSGINRSPLPAMKSTLDGWVTLALPHDSITIHTLSFQDVRSPHVAIAALLLGTRVESGPTGNQPLPRREQHANL